MFLSKQPALVPGMEQFKNTLVFMKFAAFNNIVMYPVAKVKDSSCN